MDSYESFCNPYIVSFLCFPVAVIDMSSPSEFKSSKELIKFRSSDPEVFWKYAANLQENTHAKVWFQ